jgi:hypothetical protein
MVCNLIALLLALLSYPPLPQGTPPDDQSWGAQHPSGGAPPYTRRRP